MKEVRICFSTISEKKIDFFQSLYISNDKQMLKFLRLVLVLINIFAPGFSFPLTLSFVSGNWRSPIGLYCLLRISVSLLINIYALALIIKTNPKKDIPKIILAPIGYSSTYISILVSPSLVSLFFVEMYEDISEEMAIVWSLLIILISLVAFGCWIYFGYLWVSKYLLHKHILRERAVKLERRGLSYFGKNSGFRSNLIELCLQAALFLPILILFIIGIYFMSIYEADIEIWLSLIPLFLFMLGLIVRWVVRMIKTLLGLVN